MLDFWLSWLFLPFFMCDLFDFLEAGFDELGSIIGVDACTLEESDQMI